MALPQFWQEWKQSMKIITVYGGILGFPGCLVLKNLPAMQERQVWYWGLDDPLQKEIILVFLQESLWTEEPGGLQSKGL